MHWQADRFALFHLYNSSWFLAFDSSRIIFLSHSDFPFRRVQWNCSRFVTTNESVATDNYVARPVPATVGSDARNASRLDCSRYALSRGAMSVATATGGSAATNESVATDEVIAQPGPATVGSDARNASRLDCSRGALSLDATSVATDLPVTTGP